MNIYHYHPETGVYLSEGQADPSPLEDGVWLIPAHATEIPPPAVAEGEQAAWIDRAWQVQLIPPVQEALKPAPNVLREVESDLTPKQKLARLGLTVGELRDLITPPCLH